MELNGVKILQGALGVPEQRQILADIRAVVAAAPLIQPMTPWGKPMSVRMSAAGRFGWVSGPKGYAYAPRHPQTGQPWPAIPPSILTLWERFAGAEARAPECRPVRAPECCLINFYGEGARMGLHQDRDEADFSQPVLSLSLGDDGLFRVGQVTKGGPTGSVWLASGDVAVIGGAARLAYHGVDRIRFGSSDLLAQGGRLNLTLRVVT